jgi:hypothetical protein
MQNSVSCVRIVLVTLVLVALAPVLARLRRRAAATPSGAFVQRRAVEISWAAARVGLAPECGGQAAGALLSPRPAQAFAVRLYHETRDVCAVEKALRDANLAVTETYLRFLGLVGGITIRQVFRYTLIPKVFR